MGIFNLGDIVKPKFIGGLEYFIVTDLEDFSKNQDGSEMMYDIMKIFPIANDSYPISHWLEGNLDMIAKGGEKEGKMVLDFVKKERHKRGLMDKPQYIKLIEVNSIGSIAVPKKEPDDVRYDKLDSIDQCLDAMNDLKLLHSMFGDDAFLQLQEVAQKRIVDLI